MKKRRVLGLLLSLALILGMAIPGTLASAAEAEGAKPAITDSDNLGTDTDPLMNDDTEDEIPADGNGDTVSGGKAEESANQGDETQADESKADETQAGSNTLEAFSAEGLPSEESPAHSGTCTEECAGDNCVCACHELSLFERIMACTSLDELFTIVDETPQEELLALTDEENTQIEAKIAELEPAPLPSMEVESANDEPVISEIIYPTVNFDNVAPFGDPVEG